MSFDTTAGTRGVRLPPGFVLRWGNKLMASRVRRKGGARWLGFNALALTTVGRKTETAGHPPCAPIRMTSKPRSVI